MHNKTTTPNRRHSVLKKIGDPSPPNGLLLKLFQLPIFLYRTKLGFLLGERFILLKHWGRISGELKETVIEVIDQDKASGKIYSASGYGERSQWFKNISSNNNVFITIKNCERKAVGRILSPLEAEAVLLRYADRHPNSIKGVARLSGYSLDGTSEDVIEFSKLVKIIEFQLD